jgi:hypothetical protein
MAGNGVSGVVHEAFTQKPPDRTKDKERQELMEYFKVKIPQDLSGRFGIIKNGRHERATPKIRRACQQL